MSSAAGTPVFLLGAGASRDANLPLVGDLTLRIYEELRQCGSTVVDVLEFIRRAAPEAYGNYEALFEWIYRHRGSPSVPSPIRDAFGAVVRRAPSCVARASNGWPRGDDPRDSVFDSTRGHYERAISAADTCVVIGYGFGRSDSYLTDTLVEAALAGMRLIEINPTPCAPQWIRGSRRYVAIQRGARASLTPGGPLASLLFAP